MEFLVEINIDTGDLPAGKVQQLRAAETLRARALAEQGHLTALWRAPGRWANCGVWEAEDESAVKALIDTLPLRPFMIVRVQPLEGHPSDPRALTQDASQSNASTHPLPILRPQRRWSNFGLGGVGIDETAAPSKGLTRLQTPDVSASATRWGGDACDLPPLAELSIRYREPTPDLKADTCGTYSRRGVAVAVRMVDLTAAGFDANNEHQTFIDVVRGHASALNTALANGSESIDLQITHSGAYGLQSHTATRGDQWVLDVGTIRREAVVTTVSDDHEAVQIRSIAQLTLTAPIVATPVGRLGRLLSYLVTLLDETSETERTADQPRSASLTPALTAGDRIESSSQRSIKNEVNGVAPNKV